MSSPVSFWQRVGNLFRTGSAADGNGHSDAASIEAMQDTAMEGPRPLARWGRREPTVAQMRDGYQRVVELMDALQEHFQQQDERTAHLGQSVERMVGILEQLTDTQRGEQEHIRAIAENVSAAGKHAAVMTESLSQMPKSLHLQAESMRTMIRQMEISQESDTQLMHSLQQLGQAVGNLSTSSVAQVQTLERLDAADREQKESLTLLVHEQARRFVIIIVIAAILGLGALAALATVILLPLWRH